MSLPLQFASLYDGQVVFVWSDCPLDLGTDVLVGDMVFIRDAKLPCSTLDLQPELLQLLPAAEELGR